MTGGPLHAAGDTIFALSSGLPPAAIAIMRVSGPEAGTVLRRLAGRLPSARRATLRRLRDPLDATPLDDALLLWFPGPASATGEDMAELHLHGGRAVVAALTAALARMPDMRAAAPGEFTRRAFLNGRIDLAAAEGLADLLAAETEAQRRTALAAAGGALGREIERWRVRLLDVAAQIEAVLDFADEADVRVDRRAIDGALRTLATEMAAALARPAAERLRDGLRVVIAGPPNAGKSTLLNALAGRDAAITSPHAGTTRDRIEVPVAIEGMPFVLIDTAGLRGTEDEIESIGVARAAAAIDDADILLWLGDEPPPPCCGAAIWVHARVDVPGRGTKPPTADLATALPAGLGLEDLHAALVRLGREMLPREGELSLNRRQRELLALTADALQEALTTADELLLAELLRTALRSFDGVVGRSNVEDMLDALFSGFCIGK